MSGVSAWGGIYLANNDQPEVVFDGTPRALLSQGRPFPAVHDFEHVPGGTGRVLVPGEYAVMGFLTVTGSVSKSNIFALSVNGTPQEPHFHHETSISGEPGTGLFINILTLAVGDTLAVMGWSLDGGTYCLVRDAGFLLLKLPPRSS